MNDAENKNREQFETPELEIVIIADDVVTASLNFKEKGDGEIKEW